MQSRIPSFAANIDDPHTDQEAQTTGSYSRQEKIADLQCQILERDTLIHQFRTNDAWKKVFTCDTSVN
jgi:hypothetical protein